MDASTTASIDALQEYNAGISAKARICRARGHNMLDHWAGISPDGESYINVLRCARCQTKCNQVLDHNGIVLTSEYEYPDGYLLPKGTGRVSSEGRGVFRLGVLHAKIMSQENTRHLRSVKQSA